MTTPASLPTLTVVIATYQRRGPLLRLLTGLRAQLEDDPALVEGLDVVVVVDGSRDGTVEMLEALELPVPVKTVWQQNHGRAAARNRGLELAVGEIVLFLDDDVIPLPGLLERHRRAHDDDRPHVTMGPYPFVADASPIAPNEPWTDAVYAEMAREGCARSADRFASGNASGPAELFRAVGGFDEGFTGWGCEDVELGHRLLRAGYEIRFDPDARAEHEQTLTLEQYSANNISNGRNMVRAIRLHPELADDLLPVDVTLSSRRRSRALAAAAYRTFPVKSPVVFRIATSIATRAASIEQRLTQGRTQHALYVAMIAGTLTGIAEADPSGELVARKFGIVRRR
jgi:GT2 family glycosyltransferase